MRPGERDHAVRYHLRLGLHPRAWRQELAALWAIVRTARVDEVMFFVPHAEERSPGLGSDAEHRAMVRRLGPVFQKLRRMGVAPSINLWWTVGFSDFPSLARDHRSRFRFRWAVGVDGRQSRSLACPQDRAWREHVVRMYQAYATLEPERLWIDDDVRTTLRADLHSPCFCDVCLRELSRRAGRTMTRQQWLRAIMADPPNPVRDAFLAFQEELERQLVADLVDAVHAVSPGTHVGLMFSPLEMHWAEGRRWGPLVEALGKPRPYVRPSIVPYLETTSIGIASMLNVTRLAQAALPADVVITPEIENYPGTRFLKSVSLNRAATILAQVIGISEMTFSLYRFSGRVDLEIRRDAASERMLGQVKPMLESIAALGITREQSRGVGLYWHEDVCRHARGVADQPKPIFLYRERPWDTLLPLVGLATRYGPAEVTALAGEQAACLDDGELDAMFSRGVLLDARGAQVLLDRGRGDLAGLDRRIDDAPCAVETIEDPRFGGYRDDPTSCRWLPRAWQFKWRRGAKVVSRLRDFEHRVTGHGLVLYENRLGGRVAIVPWDSQQREVTALGVGYHPLVSPSMLTWSRQAQLRAVLQWLARSPLPLVVVGAPSVYPLLVEQPERLIVAAWNLSSDAADTLTFELRKPGFVPRRVRLLGTDGRWRTQRVTIRRTGAAIRVQLPLTLAYLDVAVLMLE